MSSKTAFVRWCGLATVALVAGSALVGGAPAADASVPGPLDAQAALDAVKARCQDDMVRQTCRVMNPREARAAPAEGVVFVAGLGPVEAALYEQLRESGDAMCETVHKHCAADWNGAPCRTARALYGGA